MVVWRMVSYWAGPHYSRKNFQFKQNTSVEFIVLLVGGRGCGGGHRGRPSNVIMVNAMRTQCVWQAPWHR